MLGLSHFQLVLLSTLVVHLALGLAMDAASDLREDPTPSAPRMRMVKLDTRPPPPRIEPPEVIEPPKVEPVVVEPAKTPPPPTRRAAAKQVATPQPPATVEPPTTTAPPTSDPAPGGAPVVSLPGVGPAARGVAVASGPPTDRRTGRGGTGGGGDGAGTGSGSGVAKAVSVASIKKMAVPRGDYDYFDAQKQYPTEARQLGVGGVVRVQLTIDAKGTVVKVRLLGKGLGHGLDELALTRARTLQFDPALDTDDRPVTSVLTWTFRFEVPS